MTNELEQKLMESVNRQDIGGFCLEFALNVNRWAGQHRVMLRFESSPSVRAQHLFSDLVGACNDEATVDRVADYFYMANGYAIFADEFPSGSQEDNARAYSLMAKGIFQRDDIEGGMIYNRGMELDTTGAISKRLADYLLLQAVPIKEQSERLSGLGLVVKAVTWRDVQRGNPAESAMYNSAKEIARNFAGRN